MGKKGWKEGKNGKGRRNGAQLTRAADCGLHANPNAPQADLKIHTEVNSTWAFCGARRLHTYDVEPITANRTNKDSIHTYNGT
eukprot:365802-Chlamydomonas_euryale.AAC.4